MVKLELVLNLGESARLYTAGGSSMVSPKFNEILDENEIV